MSLLAGVSLAIQLADAVIGELNDPARTWAGMFTAKRAWLPVYKREDLVELQVSVVPPTRSRKRMTRAKNEYDYGVIIDVAQAVEAVDNDALDKLVQLVDADMTEFYEDLHYLAGLSGWSVVEMELVDDSVYSLDRLYADGIFEAALALTVRGYHP